MHPTVTFWGWVRLYKCKSHLAQLPKSFCPVTAELGAVKNFIVMTMEFEVTRKEFIEDYESILCIFGKYMKHPRHGISGQMQLLRDLFRKFPELDKVKVVMTGGQKGLTILRNGEAIRMYSVEGMGGLYLEKGYDPAKVVKVSSEKLTIDEIFD